MKRTKAILNIILGMSLASLTSCNSPDKPVVGTHPFQFNPKQVNQFMIAKSDPVTDDHWLAQFEKTGNTLAWEIMHPPADRPTLDRKADSGLLEHLLDSFTTLQIDAEAPNGALESFGLFPPRFAVQWNTHQSHFEFQLGRSTANGSHYLTLDGSKVYLVHGAAPLLLEHIENFNTLRKLNWSPLASDDVDELKLIHRGKPGWYAQREGDRWTNLQHKEIKKDITSFLNDVTQARSTRFVDDPVQAESLRRFVQSNPLYEIQLSDRHGKMTSLKIKPQAGHLYGFNSDRPNTVFVFPSQLLQSFEKSNP